MKNIKKYNLLLGVIGGMFAMAIAPGLAIGEYYILSFIIFILGMIIIDYNRGGN